MVKPCLHVSSISCFLYCVFISGFFIDSLASLPFPRPDQIEILLAFKNEFPILKCNVRKWPESEHKTKYWTRKDVKSFDGVVFDNATGVVTRLDLSGECLSGSLSANSNLFRLHHLRYLDLSYNFFDSSSFLPELGKLTNLEVLYLSHMGLAGEIPSSFSSLNRLTDLILSDNEFIGSFSPLFNLSRLYFLDLSKNHFSGNVPCSLLTMPFLSTLDLSQNHLIDSLETVNCSSSSKLKRLYLNDNRLSGRILEPLSKLTNLKKLYLSFQNTTNPFNFDSLGGFKSLESLDLSYIGLVGEIPSSISSLNRLTRLRLAGNELIGSISPLLNLSKLSFLDLSNNHFSGKYVLCSLLVMPSLISLVLSQNHLTDSIDTMNCSSSSKLEKLYLDYNCLSGRILEPLSKLSSLSYLDLSHQNTTDPINYVSLGFKSLESLVLTGNIISRLNIESPNLDTLSLRNCSINEFPIFIKNLHKLQYMDISYNRLKGEVPKWLWNMSSLSGLILSHNSLQSFEGSPKMLLNLSLSMLDLSSNAFRGSLPIISPRLRFMVASNNSFTGDIPLSLCNQSNLAIVDLSHNNFSGSIPRCLITSSVANLDLRNNNLIGILPDVFDKSGSLRALDISHNQITGKLPKSLTNCTNLEYLNVEGNSIADIFPFWLKDLPRLQVLVLRSNMFHGPIYSPQHSLSFSQLRMVDISRNKFTGRLPHDYFVNLSKPLISIPQEFLEGMVSYMGDGYWSLYQYKPSMYLRSKGIEMELEKILETYTAIDFSENKLGGQIPESIGILKSLIVLNLSNNCFTGHIPSSWANLTRLESLDLSRNQLSGNIPQELATLSFLAYINVSHNKLTGRIPQSTQMGGQPKSSFEGNLNLCGRPLEQSCFSDKLPSTPEAQEPEPSEKEQVLNWKAAAMGYGPGVLFGLAIGHVFYSYKPVLFYKLFRL